MHDSGAQVMGDIGAQLVLNLREHTTFGPIVGTIRSQGQGPMDLTGVSLAGGIRQRAQDAEYLIALQLEVLDPPARGRFTFTIPPEDVASLIATVNPRRTPQTRAFFDIRCTDSLGQVRALLYGQINVALGAAPLDGALVPAVSVPGCARDLVRFTPPNGVALQLLSGQGLAGPPGPPGTIDPDALPIAPFRPIVPGVPTPVVEPGSYAYSTVSLGLVLFDGERWRGLGGGTTDPDPPTGLTLVDDDGEVLVDDNGEVLTDG